MSLTLETVRAHLGRGSLGLAFKVSDARWYVGIHRSLRPLLGMVSCLVFSVDVEGYRRFEAANDRTYGEPAPEAPVPHAYGTMRELAEKLLRFI